MVDSQTLRTVADGLPIRSIQVSVLSGPDRGKSFRMASERMSLGTDPSNDLVLSDDTVSRFHLEIVRRDDRIFVKDHGSTNGTLYAGARLDSASVPSGAKLELGKTTIELEDGDNVTLELLDSDQLGKMLGVTPVMRQLMATIRRVARSDASVLILGETGSGKEVIAEAVHAESDRADGPFETVDCGAMLPTLIASELFGHEKGAFTGAEQRHIGAFERAHGGTLFLDEIGELPTTLQTALLGALERRQFRRVGGAEKVSVDVRLVCATHRDLRAEVNAGTFRQDVYYRIAVILLQAPPLRERLDDIPLLAEHFLRRAGFEGDIEQVIPENAMEQLKAHRWPGNVRELRNAVETALVVGNVPHLSTGTRAGHKPDKAANIKVEDVLDMGYVDAKNHLLDAFEEAYLEEILDRAQGNVSKAARDAGISRQYLTRMLRRRGIRLKRRLEDD